MGFAAGPRSPLTRQKTASGVVTVPPSSSSSSLSPPLSPSSPLGSPSLSSSMSSIPLPISVSTNQKAAATLALKARAASRVTLVTLDPLVIPEAVASSTQLPPSSPKTASCMFPSAPSPTTIPACSSLSNNNNNPTSPKSKAVAAARASVIANTPPSPTTKPSPAAGGSFKVGVRSTSRASLSSPTSSSPTTQMEVCEDLLQEWLDANVGQGEDNNINNGEETSSSNINEGLFRQADFRLGTEIGNGRFSTIYKAMHVPSGALVAVKVYKFACMDAFARNQAEREARIHLQMRPCANITRMYGTYLANSPHSEQHDDKGSAATSAAAIASSSSSLCLVQEFSEAGDLFDALRRKDGLHSNHNHTTSTDSKLLAKSSSVKLEGETGAGGGGGGGGGPRPMEEGEAVVRVVIPMLQALRFLHARGIIHRDLKPENILLCGPERVCKLCDFGFAIDGQEERPATRLGTTDYMAPELVTCDTSLKQQGAYDEMVDAWAVGVLAYEVLAGRPPFEGKTRDDTYENILRGQVALPEHFTPEAKDFCRRALEKDKGLRLSIAAMLEHPWVTNNLRKAQLSRRHASLPATGSASLASAAQQHTQAAKPQRKPQHQTTLVTSPFSAPQRSPIKA